MSKQMTNETDQIKEILDTTKNYEHLSFLKGIAGLYYRAAAAFAIGFFGLLILEGLGNGDIFYDKGIFGDTTQFSLTEVGMVVVVIAFIGDISFNFTRFITDQRYTEYLSHDDRATIVKKFSLGSVLIGTLVAVPTIILATLDLIGQALAWAIIGLFIGGLFVILAKSTGHWPSYIFGGMLTLGSVLIAFEPIPGPYWMILLMIMVAGSYITAIASYFYANAKL